MKNKRHIDSCDGIVWNYSYSFICVFYVLYNGFYVSDSIALSRAYFSAFYALLSSHLMTNKDDLLTDIQLVTGVLDMYACINIMQAAALA